MKSRGEETIATVWATKKIGDLGRVITGKTPTTKNPANFSGEYPFITIPDLDGRVFIDESARTLSQNGADIVASSLLPPGSVMMSCIATVGKCGITVKPSFTNQQINSVVPYDSFDSRFLYYVFTQLGAELQSAGGGGSVYTNVSKSRFSDIEVDLPSLPEQRRIAQILGTLDDKIELNRRMNETLEEMARAVFRDWFADFGPVRAKMEGRDAYLPEEIWRLFPDRLVESELGEVPEGWGVVPLTDMMEFKEGPGIRHWQYTNSEEGIRFINIRCIQDGELILDTANRVENEEANGKYSHFHLQEWDIVLSASGTLGRSAVVRKSHLPLLLNTSVIRFRPVDGMSSFAYLRGYLWSEIFLGEQRTLASGSVQKNFGPTHLRRMKTWLPPYRLISVHESVTGPLLRRVATNLARNDGLRGLRDSLLPGLVMGEIRVRV